MKLPSPLAWGVLFTAIGALPALGASAAVPAPDRSTPAKSMAAMMDAAEAEDCAAVRATFAATTKPAMAAADDMAHILVSLHHFHRVMHKYFPDQKPAVMDMGSDENFKQVRAQFAKMG